MPYILSPLIKENMEGMWFEGAPYSKESIYSIELEKKPPVNYDFHKIKSHSLTHIESPKHINNDGKSVDQYFSGNYFFGKCTVFRLEGNNYKEVGEGVYHWEVT